MTSSSLPTQPKVDRRGGEHDPSLYAAQHVDTGFALAEMTDALFREQFEQRGYVAIRDLFSAEQAGAARDALVDLVAGRNATFTRDRLQLEGPCDTPWDQLPMERREDVVRKLMNFNQYDVRLQAMAADDRLLHYVRLMTVDEPAIYQEMALIKPPKIGREKPWHQDHAYFPVPLDVPIVGCWIALDAATVENGCMHVLPGGHALGPIEHHLVRDWQICDHVMIDKPGCTAIPLPPGGALFFSSMLPHGTPMNRSAQRRRALQYHYAPRRHAKMPTDQHKAIFGDQAGNVPC